MNTVYNFYSEGVLNRFVLKLKQNGPEEKFLDSTRARVYATIIASIFLFGFW